MELECKKLTKQILPAVRASIAETMSKKYNYTQEAIAAKLGVVQVAVSKYLNNKYSKEIELIKSYILKNNLNSGIIEDIMDSRDAATINQTIMKLCERIINEGSSLYHN